MKFFAAAPRGVTNLLADELRSLGIDHQQTKNTGIDFQGELVDAYRVCLWSRLANRVLMPVTTVNVRSADELYQEIKAIHWERHLHSSGTLAVDATGSTSTVRHSKFAALKVKDAVVDRFRELFGERPSVDTAYPDLRLKVRLRAEQAYISIDLSGTSLHKRGYRELGTPAPLKENLAATILLAAGWPELAAQNAPLFDPMCGSGTLLIEGAMIAADIAPGLYRDYFGFLGWRRHDAVAWERLLEEARVRREEGLKQMPVILGQDQSRQAVETARSNVAVAGLADHIRVEQQEFRFNTVIPAGQPGLLVVNPPYGERLGEVNELKSLYRLLGDYLRRQPGWRAAIFTGNLELAAQIGLKSWPPLTLFNGPIECRLFRYQVEHSDDISAQTTFDPDLIDSPGAQMFANRLRKNLRHLRKWAKRAGVSCYRVYDADLPEYAVAIDCYQADELYLHVQEYRAPKSIDVDKAMLRLQEVLAVVGKELEVPAERIFLKVRQRQRGSAQYSRQADSRHFLVVQEADCQVLVNLADYLDTGLFLDHRQVREWIGENSKGKRFLNLFAYTGVATVRAALGDAEHTTTIDMSRTYLDWAQRNLALNKADAARHDFIQADCLGWLAEHARKGRPTYDLIFLDPPTFSSSKRMSGTFEVQRDHPTVIHQAMRLLEEKGTLIFSNNFRSFRMSESLRDEYEIEDITTRTMPEDFKRNNAIHNVWLIRHRK